MWEAGGMERQSRCHDYQRVPSGSIFYWLPIGCCRLPLYGLIGLSRLVSAREFANRQFPETRTRSNLVSNLNEVCRRRSTPLSSIFPSALLKQNCAYLPSPFPSLPTTTRQMARYTSSSGERAWAAARAARPSSCTP